MKQNSYFRVKNSTPNLDLDAAGPNSLAALMGRFRNEGQKEDYCLRTKPEPIGNPLLGSKYNEAYDQPRPGVFQAFNKQNMRTNNPNPAESRFKQLTPRRQQVYTQENQMRSPQRSKSPMNFNGSYHDSSTKFVYKAKDNKTLGNLIQMAENYSTLKVTSPNKVIIKKSPEEPHFKQKRTLNVQQLGLDGDELEREVSILKENLVTIASKSLPQEAIHSAIHIQIEDFLSRLIPTRVVDERQEQRPQLSKKGSNLTMLTSQATPINFSFDINAQFNTSKDVIDISTDKMESSFENSDPVFKVDQKEESRGIQYVTNPLESSEAESHQQIQP